MPGYTEGSFMKLYKWPVRFIIIVLGISVCLYIFWPNVKLATGQNLDSSEPFHTSFLIQNNSIYKIYDVKCDFIFNTIEDDNHHVLSNLSTNIDTMHLESLGQTESRPIIFKVAINGLEKGIQGAHITLLLSYKLPIIGIEISKTIPFTVERSSTNTYKWSESH